MGSYQLSFSNGCRANGHPFRHIFLTFSLPWQRPMPRSVLPSQIDSKTGERRRAWACFSLPDHGLSWVVGHRSSRYTSASGMRSAKSLETNDV